MTETSTSPSAPAAETSKKGKAKAGKKGSAQKAAAPKAAAPKAKGKVASHPPTAQMVNAAITSLDEKGGSSLHAIKKYISANYKLDATKANIFILKYLRSAVIAGKLVQTKGTGANGLNGSFRFPGKDKPAPKKRSSPKKAKKVAAKKEKAAPAVKKSTPKKKPAPKKAPVKAKSPAKPKAKKLKATAKPKKATPVKKPASKGGRKKATPKRK